MSGLCSAYRSIGAIYRLFPWTYQSFPGSYRLFPQIYRSFPGIYGYFVTFELQGNPDKLVFIGQRHSARLDPSAGNRYCPRIRRFAPNALNQSIIINASQPRLRPMELDSLCLLRRKLTLMCILGRRPYCSRLLQSLPPHYGIHHNRRTAM